MHLNRPSAAVFLSPATGLKFGGLNYFGKLARFGAILVFFAGGAAAAWADPVVTTDQHGNTVSVEQSGPSVVHSKPPEGPQGTPPQKQLDDSSEPRADDLGIITDEDEGAVFEDEHGNVAVVEQDEEPAAQVLPAD